MNKRIQSSPWLYVMAVLGVLVAMLLLAQLLTAGYQAYLALGAGLLLLLGNSTEIVQSLRTRSLGIPAMNLLVALALVLYFVGSVLGSLLFWPLSLLALLGAVPLATRRAGVAKLYLRTTRSLLAQARQLWKLRQRMM